MVPNDQRLFAGGTGEAVDVDLCGLPRDGDVSTDAKFPSVGLEWRSRYPVCCTFSPQS